jgi:hypothetical protein
MIQAQKRALEDSGSRQNDKNTDEPRLKIWGLVTVKAFGKS